MSVVLCLPWASCGAHLQHPRHSLCLFRISLGFAFCHMKNLSLLSFAYSLSQVTLNKRGPPPCDSANCLPRFEDAALGASLLPPQHKRKQKALGVSACVSVTGYPTRRSSSEFPEQ